MITDRPHLLGFTGLVDVVTTHPSLHTDTLKLVMTISERIELA